MLRQIVICISVRQDSTCPYINCYIECPLVASMQIREKGEISLSPKLLHGDGMKKGAEIVPTFQAENAGQEAREGCSHF